jgi:hypothetical protein
MVKGPVGWRGGGPEASARRWLPLFMLLLKWWWFFLEPALHTSSPVACQKHDGGGNCLDICYGAGVIENGDSLVWWCRVGLVVHEWDRGIILWVCLVCVEYAWGVLWFGG